MLEKHFNGEHITLISGPHEGGMFSGIMFINRDRPVKEI